MPYYTLDSFFPLIDDPANIFFSKLRNIFTKSLFQKLHTKALDRVRREVSLSFLGMGRVIKKVYDLRNLKPEDEGKNLYLLFSMGRDLLNNIDTTVAGEEIPVNYILYYLKNHSPKFTLIDKEDTVLISTDSLDYTDLSLYIRVGKIQKMPYREKFIFPNYSSMGNMISQDALYNLLDITGTDFTEYKPTQVGCYRNRIGWKWVINLSLSLDTTQKISFQQFASWQLYCIDSDMRESLIDDSSLSENKGNYSYIWATQYGPSIDHPTQLYTYSEVENNVITIYVVERGYERFIDGLERYAAPDAKMYYEAEPFCNTRGYVPEYFEYLFRGLKLRASLPYETAILIYSYIINMNIRYPLLSFKDDMFKVMDTIDMSTTTTTSSGMPIVGDNYYPYYMKTLAIPGGRTTSSYSPYPDPDSSSCPPRSKSIFSIVKRYPYLESLPLVDSTSSNLIAWCASNHSMLSDIRNNFISVYGVTPPAIPSSGMLASFRIPIVQNSLQSRSLSFLRWYQRELIYLMSFRRYYSAMYQHGRYSQRIHAFVNRGGSGHYINVVAPSGLRINGTSIIDNYYTDSGSTQIILFYGDIKYNSIMNFMVGCSQGINYSGGNSYEEIPL